MPDRAVLAGRGGAALVWGSAAVVTALVVWMLGDVVWHGARGLSWSFVVSEPADAGRAGGVGPMLVSTLLLLAVCLAAAVPVGFGAAIMLAEYATEVGPFGRAVRRSLDALASMPSVVLGLFGNALFCVVFGLGFSIASGGLTLACMVLPILIRAGETALRAVPQDYRAGAAALGISQGATVRRVVLPAAAPALVGALVLSVGRALAETAALVFTSGYVDRMPTSLLDSGRSLSVHVLDLAMNVAGGDENAYASATLLVLLLLVINAATSLARWSMDRGVVFGMTATAGDLQALRTAGLSLRYGRHHAFRDVSLAFVPGEITAIVGPSGCGKTSFLTCLNRLTDLTPGAVVSGSVRFGATEVYASSTDVVALRGRVGMIFQRPNPFPMSIRANLELPLKEHGIRDRAERDARLETALRDVGLWHEVAARLGSSAIALSGGQQQRLCIARALVLRPEVLLMDEPCSALDPIASGVVEDLITGLRARYTVVMVTHNLAQARRVADAVALFWTREGSGYVVEHAPTAAFFGAPVDPVTRSYVAGARG